jgi:hypothetical protein
MAYKECFYCENNYDSLAETAGGFCTLACEEAFMLETTAEIERAKQDGLVDSEGNSVLTEQTSSRSDSPDLRAAEDFLTARFNIKLKG